MVTATVDRARAAQISDRLLSPDTLILSAILAIQAVTFYGFFRREISWYPPEGYDQAAFLGLAYQLQDALQVSGLWAIWAELARPDHQSTLLFPIEGGLLGVIMGGTRLPALLVNFIGFAVAQIAVWSGIRFATNSRAFAYAALALVLLECTTWNFTAGMFDFRMDFIAFCLYGTWIALVIRGDLFLETKWSIASGLAALALILHRFISAVYVVGTSAGLLILFLFLAYRRYQIGLPRRLRNLFVSVGIALMGFLPVLVHNRQAIYERYVVGNIIGEEPLIRASIYGDSLLLYPSSLITMHLGSAFIAAAIVLLAAAFVVRYVKRVVVVARPNSVLALLFLLGSTVWPILALTLVPGKAPQTIGVVGIPVSMLVCLLAYLIAPQPGGQARYAAAGMLVVGMIYQLDQGVRSPLVMADRAGLDQWNAVVRWLTNYAVERQLSSPVLSVDFVSSRLYAGAIATGGYEQTGVLVNWRQLLGSTIFHVDQPTAIEGMKNSDIVILTSVARSPPLYPFDASIRNYWPALKQWADNNLISEQTFLLDSSGATIYARPTVKVAGYTGEWVSSAGVLIQVVANELKRWPFIVLEGTADYDALGGKPQPHAVLVDSASQPGASLPASLNATGAHYQVVIDARAAASSTYEQKTIKLTFDRFFVPKALGMNTDTRELVIRAPSVHDLRATDPAQ
jgi:hypothetical protein